MTSRSATINSSEGGEASPISDPTGIPVDYADAFTSWHTDRPAPEAADTRLTLELASLRGLSAVRRQVRDEHSMVLARVPIRIALEKDHILVATGLSSSPEITSTLHRRVVEEVESVLTEGIVKEHRDRLEHVVRQRAENPDPNADAELLDDELEML